MLWYISPRYIGPWLYKVASFVCFLGFFYTFIGTEVIMICQWVYIISLLQYTAKHNISHFCNSAYNSITAGVSVALYSCHVGTCRYVMVFHARQFTIQGFSVCRGLSIHQNMNNDKIAGRQSNFKKSHKWIEYRITFSYQAKQQLWKHESYLKRLTLQCVNNEVTSFMH